MNFPNRAKTIPCDILMHSKDPAYAESIRQYQGCPTIAVTRKGRIFAGWYSGGTCEPHIENYNLVVTSDDGGTTWSEPLLIIPSSQERMVHALDIQMWMDPQNRLHICWVQNNAKIPPVGFTEAIARKFYDELQIPGYEGMKFPGIIHDGVLFDDFEHAEWEIVCDDPDAEELKFSAPRYLFPGFLRCKPTFLKNGTWLAFAYNQYSNRYVHYYSVDQGKTYIRREGGARYPTHFDEAMAYEREDGSIRMLARTVGGTGELAESISCDGGETWTDGVLNGIDDPSTRFYVARTPSGRILLVHNDHREKRTNMSLWLSEDDGATWAYKKIIDIQVISKP